MANGIYTALSGVMTNMQQIEVISHNIANVSTPAFKMERMASQAISPPTNNNGELTFSMPEIPVSDLTQGPMVATGNPLDVALTEGVYLEVTDKGQTAYVRSSTLSVMPDGTMVDEMGHRIKGDQDVIKVPPDAKQIVVGANGDVTVDGARIDKLRLVSFQNEKNLIPNGDRTYVDNGGAGPRSTDTAAPVMAGYQEQANFSAVKEMTDMIIAHRTYDITMNAIRTINQIDKKAATGLTSGH